MQKCKKKKMTAGIQNLKCCKVVLSSIRLQGSRNAISLQATTNCFECNLSVLNTLKTIVTGLFFQNKK